MPDDSTTDGGQLRNEMAQMRAMVEALQAEVAGLRERAERNAPLARF